MGKLIEWYEHHKDKLHPVELASELHFRFVDIHPFTDGNGRKSLLTLLMNLILMKHGFPPAIVKASNDARLRYYENLEKVSIENELNPFIQLIADCLEDSLQSYIAAVK